MINTHYASWQTRTGKVLDEGMQIEKGSVIGEGTDPVLAAFIVGEVLYTWNISIDEPLEQFKVSDATLTFTNPVDLAVIPTRRIISGKIGPKDIEIIFDNGVAITGDLDQALTGQGGAVMRTDDPKNAWKIADAAEVSQCAAL